ncbi:Hypothetical predicted protein [Pelobates cultripes]|uniref:Uncharacterized protein n=1 Tax=Pelobates cultripes TaxID=61616 RepID=A0AAD1S7Z9_PELCU|nr:Hypothetical predicted protein [Pelobates cultripes]
MALTKQLKITNPVRTSKKDGQRQNQDGCAIESQSPMSEGALDSDTVLPALRTMMQELQATWQAPFRQLSADFRKNMSELGGRTSHLENKVEEPCEAQN